MHIKKEELPNKKPAEHEKIRLDKEKEDETEQKIEEGNKSMMKEDNIKQADQTAEGAIHKIGVTVYDQLYTLNTSGENLVIADVSNSEDNNVKKKFASKVKKVKHVTVKLKHELHCQNY